MSAFLLSRSLVYRTHDFLEEPWLIDHAQLMELHDLIERHWISLEEERRSELERRQLDEKQSLLERYPDISEEELAERIPRWELRELERSERSFVVWLQAGARIEADSLRDALDNPATRDHRIVRIEIELRSGNRTIQIQTRDHAGVRLETTPDTDSLAQRIFADLLRWKSEAQFPRWVGLWRLLGPIIAGYLFWLPLSVLVVTVIPSDDSALAWKAKAQSLLKDNVLSQEEEAEALGALLAKQYDLPAPEGAVRPTQSVPRAILRVRLIAAAFLLVFLVLAIPPRNTIGVGGRGVLRLRFYRWWIKIWSVGIPGVLFAGLVVEPVLSWLRQAL